MPALMELPKCRFPVSARRVKCYESPSALLTPEWFYETRDFSGRRKEEGGKKGCAESRGHTRALIFT